MMLVGGRGRRGVQRQRAPAPREPSDHQGEQPVSCVLCCQPFGDIMFCVFSSPHIYKVPNCLLRLVRRRGRKALALEVTLQVAAPRGRVSVLSAFKVGEAQL